ncbi:MAG: hypothetical protein AAGJ08_19415 [Cyanobacteria bacterium P01_H01_bin.35]
MMEHLSPGKEGRNRQTLSYGKSPDLTLSTRKTLAQEVWDIRSIYLLQGLYNTDIRKSLQELIKLNKTTWLTFFDKGVIKL